jgi:photosystem II stability/assembly factor-like uncharacterized protein
MKIGKKTNSAIIITCLIVITACNSSKNEAGLSTGSGWDKVGPGGGGAMFWPAISPHDPDYAYVACDMTGSYVTYNGGMSWRMFNLHGGVSFFTFDQANPAVVYACSIALFKSADSGKTWKIVYPVPSEVAGIISKGDHAEESVVMRDSTRREVLALAVDPANSLKLHAAISIDGNTGYYISDDQGDSWLKVRNIEKEVKNIFIDPASSLDDRTIYFTCSNEVIAREKGKWSTNYGVPGVNRLNEYCAGFDSLKEKLIIYSISGKSYFNPDGDPSGIYFSENGGKTWENRQEGLIKLNQPGALPPEWRAIATCASDPSFVYVSYSGLNGSKDTICSGVAKSEDYGKTWDLVWQDRRTRNGDISTSNYKKGWIDEQFGPGWGENPFSIAVAPHYPDICFTTDFGRAIKTADGGKTWEQIYTDKKEGYGWISRGLDVTTGYNIVTDPFDHFHRFLANTDIGLLESNDGGESWISVTKDNGIPRGWMNSTYWLVADPEVKGRWWGAMSDVHDLPRPKMWRRRSTESYEGGIVYSENGGKTWQPVSNDIGEAAITHLLIDPDSDKRSRIIYACVFGRGVYKSIDGGKTWNQKNNGIEGKEPFAWRITRNNKSGEIFLVICRRSDNGSYGDENDGAVYRSDNGGESWKRMILPEGTNGPMSIELDPDNPERMILSAWGRVSPGQFTPDSGGGIFLSADDGKTWRQTLATDQHIHDITIDTRNNSWYACGFNGSAYRSDDRGETWNRLKGYNFKWGKRVEPDPDDPEKIYVITFGGGVWHGPAKGDESSCEDIVSPVFMK